MRKRIISAFLLIAAVLGGLYWGGGVFYTLVTLGVFRVLFEYLRMTLGEKTLSGVFILFALAALLLEAVFLSQGAALGSALWGLIALITLLEVMRNAQQGWWKILAVVYVLLPFCILLWLAERDAGMRLVAFVFFMTWIVDSSAFFCGRALRGPLLWPKISPKKTISGALGAFFIAALASVPLGFMLLPDAAWPFLLGWGITLGVAVQAGDFFESCLKRLCGTKDSGMLIPGHGGLLDRLDGFIFALPVSVPFALAYSGGPAL